MISKSIKKAFELPKSKSEWIIAACWIIYLVLEIGLDIFYDIDPYAASDSELFYLWFFHQIQNISLAIALSAMTIVGIRTIRRNGFTVNRFILPAIAIFYCILITIISFYGHKTLSRIQQTLFDLPGDYKESLRGSLDNKNLSLSDRSKVSLMYAKEVWRETGEKIEYITVDGKEQAYEPSADEIETKEKIIKSNKFITEGIQGMQRAYIFWPIFLVANIAIGFLTPIRRENQIAESKIST